MKVSPIMAFALGAGYMYLIENEKARHALTGGLQKLSGMALDSLTKQGDKNATTEKPEKPKQPNGNISDSD